MRRLALLAPFALLTFTAGDATANEVPKFSELSAGRVTSVPMTKPPAFIPARESVPGLYVTSQKWTPEVPLMHRHVTIVGDPKIAAAMKTEEGARQLEDTSGACFTEAHLSMLEHLSPEMAKDERYTEWEQSLSFEANAWPKSKDNSQSGITAIHMEKVVEQNGNVTLETTDSWVDPGTRGARLITKASLPLKLVTTAVGGVKVYAGRDDRPEGRRYIQFVVMRPRDKKLQRAGTMWGVKQDGNSVHGNCNHLRVGIPTDAKGGDSAVVIAPVILPNLPREDGAPEKEKEKESADKNAKLDTAAPAPPPPPPPPPIKVAFGKKRPLPPPSSTAAQTMVEKEIRVRAMQVQVSVSRTTKDTDPVLSVSFGWANRETNQRVFEAEDLPPVPPPPPPPPPSK
jgi:hypothetical protein